MSQPPHDRGSQPRKKYDWKPKFAKDYNPTARPHLSFSLPPPAVAGQQYVQQCFPGSLIPYSGQKYFHGSWIPCGGVPTVPLANASLSQGSQSRGSGRTLAPKLSPELPRAASNPFNMPARANPGAMQHPPADHSVSSNPGSASNLGDLDSLIQPSEQSERGATLEDDNPFSPTDATDDPGGFEMMDVDDVQQPVLKQQPVVEQAVGEHQPEIESMLDTDGKPEATHGTPESSSTGSDSEGVEAENPVSRSKGKCCRDNSTSDGGRMDTEPTTKQVQKASKTDANSESLKPPESTFNSTRNALGSLNDDGMKETSPETAQCFLDGESAKNREGEEDTTLMQEETQQVPVSTNEAVKNESPTRRSQRRSMCLVTPFGSVEIASAAQTQDAYPAGVEIVDAMNLEPHITAARGKRNREPSQNPDSKPAAKRERKDQAAGRKDQAAGRKNPKRAAKSGGKTAKKRTLKQPPNGSSKAPPNVVNNPADLQTAEWDRTEVVRVGTRVYCIWPDTQAWYWGRVLSEVKTKDGGVLYNIRFDDEDEREDVPAWDFVTEREFISNGERPDKKRRRTDSKAKKGSLKDRPLEPFDKPPPPPEIPEELAPRWTYDEKTRVLLGNFTNVSTILPQDRMFLLRMMERDDISVVTEGMIASSAPIVPLDEIQECFDDQPYHKFRRFDRVQTGDQVYYKEGQFHTMKVADFIQYLKLRLDENNADRRFEFVDVENKMHKLQNVDDVVLYMIDCDMPKYLPELYGAYIGSFKIPEVLPASEFCMMNALPESARPFMGPNLYLTPGGFTSFHQDGHGTVDSGHTCVAGYNEVVMTRRLPEEHKRNAMNYLPRGHDALYHLPHQYDKTDKAVWPKTHHIKEWDRMNYCPSVFILKHSQHLHINKGRLHSFRKLTPDPLPVDDCHADLRNELLEEVGRDDRSKFLCFSVAFDWMFLGVTEEGISRETSSCIECAKLCRDHGQKSLAVPKTALLRLAARTSGKPLLEAPKSSPYGVSLQPDDRSLCRGILPSLKPLVEQEVASMEKHPQHAASPDSCPDSDGDQKIRPTDAYSNDYFCKLCHAELANTYLQCVGCEKILAKEFNVCAACYEEGRHFAMIRVGTTKKNASRADISHSGQRGKRESESTKDCKCRQSFCTECGLCNKCSCKCHHDFQLKRRFFDQSELENSLE